MLGAEYNSVLKNDHTRERGGCVEHRREIRRVYMVSSAVFGVASCVFGWAAPLGAAFGLAVSLTEDEKNSNINEFNKAVDNAFDSVRKNITTVSGSKIINELSDQVIEPDSLTELIKKTEAYRIQYCTDKDAVEIVNMFEMYFREEITKSNQLSHLFILSTGLVTLEKIKLISEVLYDNSEKLDKVKDGIAEMETHVSKAKVDIAKINNKFDKLSVVADKCMDGLVFVLTSMAVFLLLGVLFFSAYDRFYVFIAPICYGLSYYLTDYAINKEAMKEKEYYHYKDLMISRVVKPFIVSTFVAVACFLTINLTTFQEGYASLPIVTAGIALGNMAGYLLRNEVRGAEYRMYKHRKNEEKASRDSIVS